MTTRARLTDRVLPTLSGQTLSGVMALLAAFSFGTAALPSLVSRPLTRPNPLSTPAPPLAPVSGAGPEAPAPPPAIPPPTAEPAPAAHDRTPVRRPGNLAPVVERADFTNAQFTRLGDLRLRIEAWDPEGDPITVRTTWRIDGRDVETHTPVLGRTLFSRGERVRALVVAHDGSDESVPFATQEIIVTNSPPIFTTVPRGFDAMGSFVYSMGAVDPDGDRGIEFHLIEGPAGMRIEGHDGTLSWRPGANQSGSHRVRVEVRDGHGGHEQQIFDLRVRESIAPTQGPRVP